MRTDSVSLAAEAVREIREVAATLYGKDEVAEEPRVYKTSRRMRQEAHEASARRQRASRPPTSRARSRTISTAYSLILETRGRVPDESCAVRHRRRGYARRADGTQRHMLRANGSTLVKPGYISVYQEGTDDAKAADDSITCCRR